jgi:two-component system OmpR family response regulator
VVLDRMLPDLGGLDVLSAMRAAGDARPPVLVLSALGSLADRIEGLEAGGDDYLAKPFAMEELLARLNAITRRRPGPAEAARLAVGRLELDPSRHSAAFAGHQALLNRKLYSLLAHMMRHADKVVTRDMLLEHVWGYAFAPTTNIVESNMSRLRTRLLDLGIDPIETQRGHGYILRSRLCVTPAARSAPRAAAFPLGMGRLAIQFGALFALAMLAMGLVVFAVAQQRIARRIDDALEYHSSKYLAPENGQPVVAARIEAWQQQKALSERTYICLPPMAACWPGGCAFRRHRRAFRRCAMSAARMWCTRGGRWPRGCPMARCSWWCSTARRPKACRRSCPA